MDASASRVTTGTNTQKNILPRDFATFDPIQVTLQKQFQLEGRVYIVRETDTLPSPESGSSMQEAASALGCSKSVELATIAYRNAGFLVDPSTKHYQLFFADAAAERVLPIVKVLQISDRVLAEIKDEAGIRQRPVATHGARYIQHRVFCDGQIKKGIAGHLEGEDLSKIVEETTRAEFLKVHDWIQSQNHKDYLQVFFKNTGKAAAMHEDPNRTRSQVRQPNLPFDDEDDPDGSAEQV